MRTVDKRRALGIREGEAEGSHPVELMYMACPSEKRVLADLNLPFIYTLVLCFFVASSTFGTPREVIGAA